MDLKNKKLFLLDMDGTIYIDNQLIDGTLKFLEEVKKSGGRYLFLTNNSSKSVMAYVEKLNRLGIETEESDFLTSINAMITHLQSKFYKKIYAFGTTSFKAQLAEAGLSITDRLDESIDCLCMGFDTELTFQKLEDACILLGKGVDYVATNPDWVCPTSYGFVPDCGSVSEMLFRATGRRPQFIGKPEPAMAIAAVQKAGFNEQETVLIGDRLYTDIACGANAGIDTIFVLSGEGTEEDLKTSDIKPTYVCKSILSVYEAMIS